MALEDVKQLMKENDTGWLATTDGKAAFLRPMSAWLWDGDDLIFATFRSSEKVAQVAECPRVEVGFAAPSWIHVRIGGTMELVDDPAAARRLHDANPPLQKMFQTPEDPNFAVLRLKVDSIRHFDMGRLGYEDVALG
jgi:uncharacterized pyridoxamine 5'-phosphate oxidase family protein